MTSFKILNFESDRHWHSPTKINTRALNFVIFLSPGDSSFIFLFRENFSIYIMIFKSAPSCVAFSQLSFIEYVIVFVGINLRGKILSVGMWASWKEVYMDHTWNTELKNIVLKKIKLNNNHKRNKEFSLRFILIKRIE